MTAIAGGELRQLAYVVPDIEAAMRHWSEVLGVGPWFYRRHLAITEFSYRGRPSALPEVSIAFANSGALQVELVQQRCEAPSMYREFIARCGAGLQHVAWWTFQYDLLATQLEAAGYVQGHAGRVGERGRFAYYEHADMPGHVLELSEQSGGKAEFFRQVAAAAAGWDGRDPVRQLD